MPLSDKGAYMQGILTIRGKGSLFASHVEFPADDRLHEVALKSGRKLLRVKIRQTSDKEGLVDCFVMLGQQRQVAFNLGGMAGKEQITRTGHNHSSKKGWGKFTNWSCTFTPKLPA